MFIIKNQDQIDGIRKSCRLAAATIKFIEPYIVQGVKTIELDYLMDKFIKERGGIPACLGYGGFPNSTCISINETVCHGIPSERILKEGDIVSVDVVTKLNGYYGDTAFTFPVGKISEEAKSLIKVAKKCLDIGIERVKPGNNTGEIGYYISQYALLQGYTVVDQYCGHGVGLDIHESPQILHICGKNDGIVMMEGMIFTIEPMINQLGPDIVLKKDGWTVDTKDGGLSVQFEHSILVTSKGYEILTVEGLK